MRQIVLALLWALASAGYASAQSKVFNAITGAIRTDFSEVIQNRKVIGYVRLVQLEKADKNTYNYELNIMDENLNDISTAKFSDGYLNLNDVAFESDVLCVTFTKVSSSYNVNSSELYFINLEGKVLKVQTLEGKITVPGSIRNIPGVGFAYHKKGREYSLNVFDTAGQQIWSKPLEREMYYLAATPKMVSYYDLKNKSLSLMDATTGKNTYHKNLETGKNYVHMFTGVQVYDDTVYYSGFISPYNQYGLNMRYKNLKKGYQKGVVVVKAWGTDSKSMKLNEVKWDEGQVACISKYAANPDNKKESYLFTNSVTTRDGTTYLYAEDIMRKARVGKIVTSVIVAPLIIFTPILATTGYNKYYNANATVFRMSPTKQIIKLVGIEQKPFGNNVGGAVVIPQPTRSIVDEAGMDAYFISGDQENKIITNLNTKKVKYIPVSSGNISATVFPAKEGHYMLVEMNKKTKSTKLAIVAL
jgi:hypothetical protein